MHVAKAIVDGSISQKFFQHLKNFAVKTEINVINQRINMNMEKRAWEHEVYNIRHIHAFTLSHFKTPYDPLRFIYFIFNVWKMFLVVYCFLD